MIRGLNPHSIFETIKQKPLLTPAKLGSHSKFINNFFVFFIVWEVIKKFLETLNRCLFMNKINLVRELLYLKKKATKLTHWKKKQYHSSVGRKSGNNFYIADLESKISSNTIINFTNQVLYIIYLTFRYSYVN